MKRVIAVFSVGAAVITVYLATLQDGVLRVAVCPARISDQCRTLLAAEGIVAGRYERVRIPVTRKATAEGFDFSIPEALGKFDRCVEVDWPNCDINTAASDPVVAGLWDAGWPIRLAATRTCVRARYDAGLPCARVSVLRRAGDVMGTPSEHAFPRAEAVDPATCQPVECGTLAGEEEDL